MNLEDENSYASQGQKVAIIGSGISGLGTAWALRKVWNKRPESKDNEVVIFEAGDYIGGHTHTVYFDSEKLGADSKNVNGSQVPVDTGFIVYNTGQYPNMVRFFEDLGVETQESDMSFSLAVNVRHQIYRNQIPRKTNAVNQGVEWGSDGLDGLFAQRSRIFSPSHWKFAWDMLRFNSEAVEVLNNPKFENVTLGEYMKLRGYSDAFMTYYLLPMTGAIWSTPSGEMMQFPIQSMITFMANHKLLQIGDRYIWRTVKGGSIEYVKRVVQVIGEKNIKLNKRITSVVRQDGKVVITDQNGAVETFDQVVFACHGDTALKILGEHATKEEQSALSDFSYKDNKAYLHCDKSLMPRQHRAWTSWNVLSSTDDNQMILTYWMNRLQHWLPQGHDKTPVLVTLNPARPPAAEKTWGVYDYAHPVYSLKSLSGQNKIKKIQGENGTYFAGAHLGFGFHEDGFTSGLICAKTIAGESPFEIDMKRYEPQQGKPNFIFKKIETAFKTAAVAAIAAGVGFGAKFVYEKYGK